MASIGGTGNGRGARARSFELPLVPFIDLLLCCVMFLLVSAVWNRVASMDAEEPLSSDAPTETEPSRPVLVVRRDSYVLRDGFGLDAPVVGAELAGSLESLKAAYAGESSIGLAVDPDVPYGRVIATMDTARVAGFSAPIFVEP